MAVTSEGRVALYLQDKHPLRDGMHYAQYAEERGFEAVWQAESRLVREATVPMAAFAAVTSRIKVASGVIPIWTRNVGLLAATFSTLDELAPGRVMLGLGAWWEPLATKVGVDRRRPLLAMRETVEATRRLLAMERVTFHGEFVHLDDVEIDIVHGDRSPKHVPIYVGATGMQMMEVAGEIGDGVVLNYMVGPAYNKQALAALATGAAPRGPDHRRHRPPAARGLLDGPRPRGGPRPQPRAAHAVPRPAAAHHEGQRRRPGADRGDRQGAHLAGLARGDQARRCGSCRTTPCSRSRPRAPRMSAVAKVAEYVANGATCPILYPLGDDVELMIDTFAVR